METKYGPEAENLKMRSLAYELSLDTKVPWLKSEPSEVETTCSDSSDSDPLESGTFNLSTNAFSRVNSE